MKAPRTALTAAVVAAALVLAACASPAADEGSERAESLTIVGGLTTNWDPVKGGALIFGTLASTQTVYESLVVLDNVTLEYDPWLAEEFTVADDRLSMTMTLRDDVVFTDGERLTAEGVKKLFDAIMADGSNYAVHEFSSYEPTMEVTGELRLEITTVSGINGWFFDTLSYLPIVSPVALDDLEKLTTTPIGTGPYVLESSEMEVSQTYVRNPDYWNPDAYDFDSVTYMAFADKIAAVNALISGQVDAVDLPISEVEHVKDAGFTISVGGGEIYNIVWVDRDDQLGTPVADVRVRQAISHAFDREAIAENIDRGYGVARSQTFTEVMPQYIEGGDDRYPYDPEKARDLLAEAGYPDGFELTLPFINAADPYMPVIQSSLADIGITLVAYTGPDTFEKSFVTTNFPFVIQACGEAGLLSYMAPGGAFNNYGPAEPLIEDLFDRIDNGTPDDSAEASQELGELLLDEAWYIPISQRSYTWGLAPGIAAELGDRMLWPISLRDFSLAD